MSLFIHIRVQSLFYRSTETRIRVRESTVVNVGDHDHDEGEAAEAEETWSLGGSAITVKSSSPARDWSSFGTFSATTTKS